PIRTVTGYYLILLIERRLPGTVGAARIDLHQAMLPVPRGAGAPDVEAIKKQLVDATKAADSCKSFDEATKQLPRARSLGLGKIATAEVPGQLQQILAALKPGQKTPPLQPDQGTIMMFMVCGREDGEAAPLPARDDIKERISQQRIELLSRRYLRDLRRTAFV